MKRREDAEKILKQNLFSRITKLIKMQLN